MTTGGEHSPPDRSGIPTEARNPRSASLHRLSVAECVRLMNEEDARVIEAVARAAPALTAWIEALVPRFDAGGRLIYVGAGTSGRLGVLDAAEAPPTFQLPPGRIVGIIAGGESALRASSEGLEDDPEGAASALEALGLDARDAVLGIAAGGTTPYVRGALAIARRLAPARSPPGFPASGVLTGFLTCAPTEADGAIADHVIHLDTGAEVLTGSTRLKAGSATKMALNIISTTLMARTGRVYENLMVDLRATNDKLRDRAARVVATLTGRTREASLALLDEAGGEAKTAVVMARRSVGAAAARAILARCGGRLGDALEG